MEALHPHLAGHEPCALQIVGKYGETAIYCTRSGRYCELLCTFSLHIRYGAVDNWENARKVDWDSSNLCRSRDYMRWTLEAAGKWIWWEWSPLVYIYMMMDTPENGDREEQPDSLVCTLVTSQTNHQQWLQLRSLRLRQSCRAQLLNRAQRQNGHNAVAMVNCPISYLKRLY